MPCISSELLLSIFEALDIDPQLNSQLLLMFATLHD
jgi:hypothetical protein